MAFPQFFLRDYQREMLDSISRELSLHRSVMVQMPTGTGKTHVLAAIVSEELRGKSEESNSNIGGVWIIAHRRELVAQIEETVGKMLVVSDRHSLRSPTVGSSPAIHADAHSSLLTLRSSLIKVVSIQWLSRHWDDVKGTPSLVIIDEAHHAVAETYREMWSRYPRARFLGFTATPCRMNNRGFTDLFDTLITSWSIAEFIEKKYLSAFDYISIRQGSEEQRLIDSLEKRGTDGDYQIKEMNERLNRNTSIKRLYESMERFAGGKKGIVYAISIGHAQRIAEYYSGLGVNAVPIDSRTPVAERKRMVEDFKAGRIKVLVNVDIFSEGFDCPDVEFVQMARPTLSLAKYLQQVGRGLRKAEGKEACVLIDNVGLYRVFGLPTVVWDWEAMFRGAMAGKAMLTANMRSHTGMTAIREVQTTGEQEDGMEVIVSHEQLLAGIGNHRNVRPMQADRGELKAWQDKESGRWGLRRGKCRTTEAMFVMVFDTGYDMAAVMFKNKDCGIVNDEGEILWKNDDCQSVRFLKDGLLLVTTYRKEYYVDIYGWRTYMRKPKVRRFGKVELLELDYTYYSRTKTVYVTNRGIDKRFIHWWKFYLTIYDEKVPFPASYNEDMPSERYVGHACILEGDHESYYWLYCRLADGSIIVMDNARRYYHATEERSKKYIGCRESEEEWNRCRAEIERIARHSETEWQAIELKQMETRRQQLAESGDVAPFRSGVRWGLKVGDRVIVPPIYRMVRLPVGMYCAVEKNYGQWGIISIDGTVMVEPKYTDVSIEDNGTAQLTYVTGRRVCVRLR